MKLLKSNIGIFQEAGVYKITNILNEKSYIGSSVKIRDRLNHHRYLLYNKRHHNLYLQRAWDKYGPESFKFEVLEYCSIENRVEKEQYFIDFYHSNVIGYNLRLIAASNRGLPVSKETRKKMSLKSMGHPVSEETKRKIKEAKGPLTDETRKKMSDAKKGKRGHHHSAETKEKMSKLKKGIPRSEEVKRLLKGIKKSESHKKKLSEVRQTPHQIKEGIETKYCATCNQWLKLSLFYNNNRGWDKLTSQCKSCINKQQKERKNL